MVQPLDSIERLRECHAVSKLADAFLEGLHGSLGMGAKEAICLAAGEAEDVQGILELAHIVAVEVREAQIQGAVAHLIALVHKRCPGLGIHSLAERQIVLDAELRDRICRRRAKVALVALLVVDLIAKMLETVLDILDSVAACSLKNGIHPFHFHVYAPHIASCGWYAELNLGRSRMLHALYGTRLR